VNAELLLFDALAGVAVFAAAAMVIVARSAVAVATALLACLTALSGVLVLLGAELVGVVQLIVQAGSVTVLLLMIFLLVGAEGGRRPTSRPRDTVFKLVGCGAAAGIALLIVHAAPGDGAPAAAVFSFAAPNPARSLDPNAALYFASGGHRAMGLALYRSHLLPLQILALLLLAAVVGSVSLAGRRAG
jgi:NADH:ubiquinone oxidoreductase subunit 6 (subunit J)